jgi:hypothetical protein
MANDLDAILRKAARARAAESRYEADELYNEAWVYASDPVRAKTVQHHLANDFQDDAHRMTVGELRLYRIVDHYLDTWIREQDGLPPREAPRSAYGEGQQTVQIHHESRRTYWDGGDEWAEPTMDEAFPFSGEAYGQGYSIEHVEPEYGEWEPLKGRYGFAQEMPFGIITHALDLGVISAYQADLLKLLMDGDSATDLACRYPEESKGAIQTAVSRAIASLRNEPKVQEWAQSLGFDPLAPKGRRWESEHRHNDGRPAGPAAARPFICDCDRGQASYNEDALDRSDPFLKLLQSDTGRVSLTPVAA